jgi:hypothetical protein
MMDAPSTNSCIEQIGQTAGLVWQTLNEQGPQTLSKLIKSTAAPRDVVLQAVGWLAREDKLWIEEKKRVRTIGLR